MRRLRCAEVDALADRYVDHSLAKGTVALIEAHLAACGDCRDRVESARDLLATLSEGDPVAAPPGFTAAVMDEVYRETLWGATVARPRGATVARPKGLTVARPMGRKVGATAQMSRRGAAPRAAQLVPARVYRRLGLSLVLSAGVLCAVLTAQPRFWPGLHVTRGAPFSRGDTAIVRGALESANRAIERILRSAGGSAAGMLKGEAR